LLGIKDFLFKHRIFLIILLLFGIPFALYWRELLGNIMMVSGDGYLSLSKSFFEKNALLHGELPLWNGFSVLGTPYLSEPGNSFFYPLKLILFIFPPVLFSNLYYILSLGLGGIFTYFFVKEATKRELVSIIAAVVFLVSIFIGGYRKEHTMVYSTIIWLPLILFFILRFADSFKRKHLVFTAMAMSIQFFAGFPQICFYTYILAFAFFLYLCITRKRKSIEIIKDILITGLFLVAFTAIELLPQIKNIMDSGRGSADFFSLFSTQPEIALMTVFPYVFGDIYNPLGPMSSAEISIELYIGIIPLIYALYAIRYHFKEKLIRFFAIAAIIAFVYSSCMHIPLLGQFISKIPVLGMFNVQSRIMFIAIFSGVFCFAWGIKDLNDAESIKRLARFSFLMFLFVSALAIVIFSASFAPTASEHNAYLSSNFFNIFGISIIISAINALCVSTVYIIRNKEKLWRVVPVVIMVVLCMVTVGDVWRFSKIYAGSDYEAQTHTSEIQTLLHLPGIQETRITAIMNSGNYYGSIYQESGLIDNRSTLTGIRNINGWTEFENYNNNKLLGKAESRYSAGVNKLIAEGNDILSMLAVRYVLCPKGSQLQPQIPKNIESQLLFDPASFNIPADGKLFEKDYPMTILTNRYYLISFDMSADDNGGAEIFYVDFYGGTNYDRNEQQKNIEILKGNHSYNVCIYSGDNVPPKPVNVRIVSISHNALKISNVRVSLMAESTTPAAYRDVAETERYTIYENLDAKALLNVAKNTKNITDGNDLINYPDTYPGMDKTSYVENFKDMSSDGELSDILIKTNSVTAKINTQRGAFVNHAQSFQADWKAYIDGQQVPIFRVNGVIQGIEVPPGQHNIRFVFDPGIVKIGIAITLIGIATAILFLLNCRYNYFKRNNKTGIKH
jgi:hypothetical protein